MAFKWEFFQGPEGIEKVTPTNEMKLAVLEAQEARATPYQSGYHVNTGAVTKGGHSVRGSNHEMGITNTITHGEEAVITAALELYGDSDPIAYMAF